MPPDNHLNFRLRGIPLGCQTKLDVCNLVKRTLSIAQSTPVTVHSLSLDPSDQRSRVATLTFDTIPSLLPDLPEKQWVFYPCESGSADEDGDVNMDSIVFDTHFTGFTPLNAIEDDACHVEIIALSGLGGHAFGSFKSPNGRFMWLRDALPKDISGARIMIYGYDTSLVSSNSFQNLKDLGKTLQEDLRYIRRNCPSRSLIFIGHSLGGLVIEETLNMLQQERDEVASSILQSTSGILFFGVPNQGMETNSLVPLVQDNPNRAFLESLGKNSGLLQNLQREFVQLLHSNRLPIFSFYETKESPTAINVEGIWKCCGPNRVLVDIPSATCVSPFSNQSPINRNHSEMVKYSDLFDKHYVRVRNRIWSILDKPQNSSRGAIPELQNETSIKLLSDSNECLRSLSFPEQKSRLSNIHCEPDTCGWLLKDPSYQAWVRKPQGFFWIKGNPGSGKSVLMKYALQTMKHNQPGAVVASFFIHGQGIDLQKSPIGLFRTLLHSLLESFPNQLNELTEKFKDYQKKWGDYKEQRWLWNMGDLKECLREVLIHGTNNKPAIIFIDALDECGGGDAKQLLEYFESLMGSAERGGSQVKICLSSRHYPILGQNHIPTVFVEKKNHQDIRLVVERRLRKLGPVAESQKIREKILSKAQGGFQWVILITEKVKDEFTSQKPETLLEMVSVAPGTLDGLYAGITNQATEPEKKQMIKLFRWILFAKRPLAAQELREAIATDQDMTYRTISELTTEKSWIGKLAHFKEHIKKMSKGLVCFEYRELWETHPANKEDWDQEAQFIHQSAAEFARQVFLETSMGKSIYQSLEGACHFAISRSCLKYLALEEIVTSPRLSRGEIFASFPLVPYIVDSFFYHIRETEQENIPQLDLLSLLDWTEGLKSLAAIWTILDPFHANSPMGWPFVKGTVLHRLVVLGSRSASDAFIGREDVHINGTDEYGNTPLHLTIREDQRNIALMLLNRSIETQSYAQEDGNRAGRRVKVNIENHDGETPLDIALFMGAGEIIHKLIETGAELQSFGRHAELVFHAIRTRDEILFAKLLSPNVNLDGAIYFAINEGSYANDDSGKIEYFVSELIRVGANTKHPARATLFSGENSDEEESDDDEESVNDAESENDDGAIYASLWLALRTCQIPLVLHLLAYHVRLCPEKTLYGVERCLNDHANRERWLNVLIVASMKSYTEVARALFDISVNNYFHSYDVVLDLESRFQSKATLRYFVEQGVDVNIQNEKGYSALHLATRNGNIAVVRFLIAKGANVNISNTNGLTPLHCAPWSDSSEIARMLIREGARVNISNACGATPLHFASELDSPEIARMLIKGGVNINASDNNGRTSLHYASHGDSLEIARMLIEGGANINASDNDGWTPLHHASKHNHLEIAKVLVEGGANISASANDGWTPLHCASHGDSSEIARMLIEGGTNINASDNDGWTPLHCASKHNYLEIAKVLVEGGANVNASDNDGWAPLHCVSFSSNPSDIIRMLIEGGANINASNNDGCTPLHYASYSDSSGITRMLIKGGANINTSNNDGCTPLHYASYSDSSGITRIFIEGGANINASDRHGWTPLRVALECRSSKVARILIEKGANVNACN